MNCFPSLLDYSLTMATWFLVLAVLSLSVVALLKYIFKKK
jgi:hypothetical protein